MAGDIATFVVGVAVLVGLAVLILWTRDRISAALWARKNPPEKLAADRRAYEERILRPDWDFYERYLQRPVPAALRELFADHKLISAQNLRYEDGFIDTFVPLDANALTDPGPFQGLGVFPLAYDGSGDAVHLRPGPAEIDAVYITHHDGDDTEVFAESVAQMIAILRAGNGGRA